MFFIVICLNIVLFKPDFTGSIKSFFWMGMLQPKIYLPRVGLPKDYNNSIIDMFYESHFFSKIFNDLADLGRHKLKLTAIGEGGKKSKDKISIAIKPVSKRLQRINLKVSPNTDRFKKPLTLTWPKKYGEAQICLWEDDKFAAVSITIDDNIAVDHSWWIKIGKEYGWQFTWFIIINSLAENSKNPYFGSWPAFQALVNLGHDVQSHSISHESVDETKGKDDDKVIHEYQGSLKQINQQIVGNRALTLAWPWGKFNRDLGALFVVAGRGTVATPNKAERIDYLNINSSSAGIGKNYLDSILKGTSTTSWLGKNRYIRGWFVAHYHFVKDKQAAMLELNALYLRSSRLWVGLFKDVARYGQERDTAKLAMIINNSKKVKFRLSDQMDDSIFDYPLTIKVRLYPKWRGVTVTQAGKKLEATLISQGKRHYALIKVIPDRGDVVVQPSSNY